jgi:hypothetical protein
MGTVIHRESYSFNRSLILNELERTLAAVSEVEIAVAQRMILTANRVFLTGAGRTGLALKMIAMRLMHLGLAVMSRAMRLLPRSGPATCCWWLQDRARLRVRCTSPARYHLTSSTRRFFALPSSVSFDATGA